jgi:hypothetical protein
VQPFKESHAASVGEIVVWKVCRIVGIPHCSQCRASDTNSANANDGRGANMVHQAVITLVSAEFHEHKIKTPAATRVRSVTVKYSKF